MPRRGAIVRINGYNDSTLVTVNNNSVPNIPSTVAVTVGGSRKSLIIFSVIMTCIFVGTAVTIQSVIRNKEKLPTPTTKQKETKMMTTAKARITTAATNLNTIGFATPRIYSTGIDALPIALAVVDVNNDNKPDIIVANQYGFNVGVLLNNYKGMFLWQETYSTGPKSHPQYVSVVDINGDNKSDIVVANNGANGVGVFLNFGNGTFLPQTAYKTGNTSYPTSVTVADVNNDKKPDIIVTNQNENNIGILFNLGDGTFTSQMKILLEYGSAPTSPSVVDINDDNYPDIIFGNYGGNTVGVLFNFGNGTFHSLTTYSTGFESRPRFVSVVDVNQDDKPDIVVANSNKSNVGILLNSGDGTFFPQYTYSTGNNSSPRCVSVVDLNGDNKPEIIVANHDLHNIGIFVNIGSGTFLLEKTYSTGSGSNPRFVSVVDVNGDHKPDIIVANSKASTVGVMLAS